MPNEENLQEAVEEIESGDVSEQAVGVIERKADEIQEDELISKTEERIAALGLGSTPATELADTDDDDEVEDDSTPEEKPADETDDDTETESDSTPEEKPADEEKVGDDEIKEIPDSYYRAAIHQGWKPEEIEELYKEKPELALKTFGNLLTSTNKLSSQFAELGRAKLRPDITEKKEPAKVTDTKVESIDIEKLRETYKDDPIVDVIIQQQKQQALVLQRLDAQAEELKLARQNADLPSKKEQELITQQVEGFFGADDMKIYDDFYGSDKDESGKEVSPEALMPGQRANRAAVIEEADAIIAGFAAQGREISVPEALERAHMVITAPLAKQKIRAEIKKEVVKRSKGISLKGSGKKKVAAGLGTSGALSQKELEIKTAKRISKLLNS